MTQKKHTSLFQRLFHSPTLNTWFSYSTKALSLFVVLPLLLHKFSVEEVALWYIFATVIALQGIADLGFRFTFVRFIAYAQGGAEDILGKKEEYELREKSDPNLTLLGKIYSLMTKVYLWLTLALFLMLLGFGTWALIHPIGLVQYQQDAWIAWIVIIVVSTYKFYGTIYSNYLEGINQIALVRRWEGITSIGAILTSVVVLLIFESLLALVIANQIWVIINVVRNKILLGYANKGSFKLLQTKHEFDKPLFKKIWEPAWKSGISGIMSNSLSNFMSIIYAQVGNSVSVASYMLALRLIGVVKDISVAPYYTKLPSFAMLYSQGKKEQFMQLAQKGMFVSNLIFIIGSIAVGELAHYMLDIIDSDVSFVSDSLWILLMFAYFIHRFGAMHIHLYSTSNHIISHIADGVSGVIFLVTTFILLPIVNLYAIPIGLLAGYLGFYAWYSAYHSYSFMKIGFFAFEKKASLLPFGIFILYTIYKLYPLILNS